MQEIWKLQKASKEEKKHKNELSFKDKHFDIWMYVLLALSYACICTFLTRMLSICTCHFVRFVCCVVLHREFMGCMVFHCVTIYLVCI